MRNIVVIGSVLLIFTLLASTLGAIVIEDASDSKITNNNARVDTVPTRIEIATRLADSYFLLWYEEMLVWADEQEPSYTDDGEEIAFDASIFFQMKYKELLAKDDPELMELYGSLEREPSRKMDGYTKTNTGTNCDIYVETGSNSFESLKNEFDNTIYPSNSEAFGTVGFKIEIYVFYADGSSPDSDGVGGWGGFFTPGRPRRVYIDSSDMNSWGFEILAHEHQHLIHNQKDPYEYLWINEGCADWAIVKAYGQNAGGVRSHLAYYEMTPDNDLTQFDNKMYDYGGTCAFITYLADHYGGDSFTKSLLANSGRGFSGVSQTLSSLGHSDDAIDAYLNWLVANYLDDTTIYQGEYGYSNLNIKVDLEGSYSSYPMTDNSEVKSWGADYYRFSNGREGLGVEFQGKGGGNDFGVWIIRSGSSPTSVEYMELDSADYGKHPLPGFGTSFTSVIAIVTADEDADYEFGIHTMDTTPPVTSITIDPIIPDGKNSYYVSTPTATLGSEEDADTYYYWNGNEEEIQTYTGALQIPEGANTLYFYSIDINFNKETPRTYQFLVDTIKPETGIVLNPENPDGPLFNGWYISHPLIEITEEEGADSFYRWDDGDDIRYEGIVEIIEGAHTLYYWSKDIAGNTEEANSLDLKIDTITPVTTANLWMGDSPLEDDEWCNRTVTVELVSNEDGETFYTWDEGNWNLYENELESHEGAHILSFYSIDEAGNQEGFNDILIKMDTIAPSSSLAVYPEAPDGNNDIYVTLPEVYISCDDEDASIYYFWDEQLPVEYDPLMDEIMVQGGTHTLSYYSVDIANNMEEIKTLEISVDLYSPTTNMRRQPLSPNGGNDWYNNITLTLSSNSADVDKTYYFFDNDQREREYKGPINEEIEDGERTFYYFSVDEAGNRERTGSFSFKLDTSPPRAVVDSSPQDIWIGDEISFSAMDSKDNIGVEHYKFTFGDGSQSDWITTGNITHSYTRKGTYTVGLRVRDESGLESEIDQSKIEIREKNDDDGLISFLPSGAGGSLAIILMAVLVVGVMLMVLILYSKKRKKKNKEEAVGEEEEESVVEREKEAKRLYGMEEKRKEADTIAEDPIYGSNPEETWNDTEYYDAGGEAEREERNLRYHEDADIDYYAFDEGSRYVPDIEYLPEMGVEDNALLPEYGWEEEISYDDEGEITETVKEKDLFFKEEKHEIVDLIPMGVDEEGEMTYASSELELYDAEEDTDSDYDEETDSPWDDEEEDEDEDEGIYEEDLPETKRVEGDLDSWNI